MLSSSISRVKNNIKAGKKRNVIKMDEFVVARLAEEATTRSGEDALFAVDDDDVASTGSFHILIAFHVPAATNTSRESEKKNNIWLLYISRSNCDVISLTSK
jgi:hypothetical protein